MTRLAPWALALTIFAAMAIPAALVDQVEEVVLDNGMTFLLHRRGDAPVFSGVIRWNVGSVDEPNGLTGIAHMFEHMAFKGTTTMGTTDWEAERPVLEALNEAGTALVREKQRGVDADPDRVAELQAEYERLVEEHREFVVKDELDEIYSAAGAVGLNAGTGRDFTTYHVSMPSNALELWCLVESARIRDAVLREFYSERDVVYEERRLRTDTDPTGALVEELLATAFLAHPYGEPTIGWPTDIENLTTADAEIFFREHYAPVNACGAIVGDFDLEEGRALVERHFGPIPAGDENRRVSTEEPAQRGVRQVAVEWEASPTVLVGFHKPNPPAHMDAVFDVMHAILTRGRSSRLYKRMVKEEQVVTAIDAFSFPGDKYPNLSCFYALPRAPHTSEEVEAMIYEELEKLKVEPVTEQELQRVRNQLDADFLRERRSNMGLAQSLTYWHFIGGDWRLAEGWRDELLSVTPKEIMEAASTYYVSTNRTVGEIVPRETADAEGGE